MGGRRETERKLDMALSDLVDEEHKQRKDEGSRSPHRNRRDRDDFRGKGSFGKGKGKRRLAPEEKALLNTHCFFNDEGDLVVRLYDTQVFVLKKKPEAADEEGKASAGADGGGVVLVLNSGGFRTMETRHIINQAMYPLEIWVAESGDSNRDWKVSGKSFEDQSFKDKMEVQLKSDMVRASTVKEHLEDKIQKAKNRDGSERSTFRRRGDFDAAPGHPMHPYGHPAHGGRYGMPPPVHWPHGPPPGWLPPPAWGGLPPPGMIPPWAARPPPHHPVPYAVSAPPPHAGGPPGDHGAPLGGKNRPPPEPRGPLPASMFQ